ncbi:MAG: AtpZ/AtpI family protein [Candidatus Woesebacteria bacterium]|jgi:hypothetical protein
MKPNNTANATEASSDNKSDALTTSVILLTMADTTWRIFTPVILFAGLGIWLDVSLSVKPWATLLGVVLGFAFAGWLVKKQIVRIQGIK